MVQLPAADASAAAAWGLQHGAQALGSGLAALALALLATVVVGVLVFVLNAVCLVAVLRRDEWPAGHRKSAWAIALPVAFVLAVALPGFLSWLGVVGPLAYWLAVPAAVRRERDAVSSPLAVPPETGEEGRP